MSTSSSETTEMSLVNENNQEDVHSNPPEIPRLKIEDDNDVIANSHKPSLGELMATDDDDEGFKTPTSLESKIPVPTECPPAPKRRSYLSPVSPTIRKRKTAHIFRTIAKLVDRDLLSLFTDSSDVAFPESSDEDDSPQKINRPPKDRDHDEFIH